MLIFRNFIIGLHLAIRAKFIWMSGGGLSVVVLTTVLSTYFGGRQSVTVGLDVGISTMRLLLPLLIVLVVQELLSREFDKRYYLASLTYPCDRRDFLLGRFAALLVLLMGLVLMLGLLQACLMQFLAGTYPQATPVAMGWHYLIVMAFIWLDLLLLAALATLLAVVASTQSFVLIGTFGFMLVARSYGAIVEMLGQDFGLVLDEEGYRTGLGVLGYLLPDLGALDMRMLALYGKMEFLPSDWSWLVLSNLAYTFGLLGLAVWSLQRKRFA